MESEMDSSYDAEKRKGTAEGTVLGEPNRNGTIESAHGDMQTQGLERFFKPCQEEPPNR